MSKDYNTRRFARYLTEGLSGGRHQQKYEQTTFLVALSHMSGRSIARIAVTECQSGAKLVVPK